MTLTIEIASDADATSWSDLTNYIAWDQGFRCGGQAAYLDVGTASGWMLDDDAPSAVIPAKRVVRMIETATTPDTVLFKGRVSDKNLKRGTKHSGDATQFDTTLDDNNSQLLGIPVDGWKRPEETGRARIRALMAAFCAGDPRPSTDLDYTTYVPNTNTVTMPPKTYTNTDVASVAKDCADTEGKQCFVTVDDELFYDVDTSTAYAATMAITDSSPNLTSQFPPIDASGSYVGNEFISGATIKYGDKNRSVSDVNATAEANHDYWRTIVTDGGKNATQAAAKLATLLANQSQEERTFSCDVLLLKTQVDKAKYGQTISFRSGAAGVTTPTTFRITQLTWEPVGPDHYIAHFELGVPKKLRRRIRDRPNTDPPANPLDDSPFVCVPTDWTVPTEDLDVMTCVDGGMSYSDSPDGDNSHPSNHGRSLLYHDSVYRVRYTFEHFDNCDITLRMGSTFGTLEADGVMGEVCGCGGSAPITEYTTTFNTGNPGAGPGSRWWELQVFHTNYSGCTAIGTTATAVLEYVSGPDPRFEDLTDCENGAPRLGQRVIEVITSDGSTTLLTTNHAYSEGSLDVRAAGVHLEVQETDPLAGEFTLVEAVPAGAVIEVQYRASDPTPLGTGNTYLDERDASYNIPYTLLGTGGDGSGDNVLHDDGTWSPGGGGGGSALEVLDEGVTEDSAVESIDFVGSGVSVSHTGHDVTVTIPGGVTDHGALTGLSDDDHPQYATNAEFDDHSARHESAGADAIKLDDLKAPDDNTDLDASTSKHGLLPKLGGGTTNFLRADGAWAAPGGGYSDPLTTRGDILRRGAASTDRYAIGAAGKALVSDGTDPVWADQYSAIEVVVGTGLAVITAGVVAYYEVPFDCVITRATVLADVSGSIQFDIWKDAYANFPPVVGDSITASAKPTLSSAQKSQDSTLTGWTTALAAGDILAVNVDSASTVKKVTLSLQVKRS